MIKFALVCDKGHEFESWFRSGDDYEAQVKRGFVDCPACGSMKIGKAVMAPAVARRDRPMAIVTDATSAPAAPSAEAPAPQPVALLDERQAQLRAMVRELHAKIAATTTDVGARFPDEARRMKDGEIPEAPIRGEATLAEARELWEEGIPVMPIPTLPEDRN